MTTSKAGSPEWEALLEDEGVGRGPARAPRGVAGSGGGGLGEGDSLTYDWVPFTPPEFADCAAPRLDRAGVRWAVAGGWAVDLALGCVTREHEDLEIAIRAAAFPVFREALSEFTYLVPFPSGLRPVEDEVAMAESHQTRARDADGRYRFDVVREPHDGDVWICRRNPALRRPYTDVLRVAAGVPYVVPEIVLLFKAKYLRTTRLRATAPAPRAGRRCMARRRARRRAPGPCVAAAPRWLSVCASV